MTRLSPCAAATLGLLDAGGFETAAGWVDLATPQSAAKAGTHVVTPAEFAALPEPSPGRPAALVVEGATTQQAARRRAPEVVVLNFASARNVGGGFLGGAKAQEEDLCRCSGLFRCLAPQEEYYRQNRAQPSTLYTDHAIWSPGVPFFREHGGEPPHCLFLADVITAPAPNRGPMAAREPESIALLPSTFERRWRNVLALAAAKGRRRLVLGAWGCGAFGNDPHDVATAFLRVWPRWASAFDEVVFAIPATGARSRDNLEVFRRLLGA